jgi:hypothetical protein
MTSNQEVRLQISFHPRDSKLEVVFPEPTRALAYLNTLIYQDLNYPDFNELSGASSDAPGKVWVDVPPNIQPPCSVTNPEGEVELHFAFTGEDMATAWAEATVLGKSSGKEAWIIPTWKEEELDKLLKGDIPVPLTKPLSRASSSSDESIQLERRARKAGASSTGRPRKDGMKHRKH